jgi:hypothetical protein
VYHTFGNFERSVNDHRKFYVILTGASWGEGRIIMLRLYCCLILLQLDYGSFICASASKRILYFLAPSTTLQYVSVQGPLEQADFSVCTQKQGNLHLPLNDRFYCAVMPKYERPQKAPLLRSSTPAFSPTKFCAQFKGKASGGY